MIIGNSILMPYTEKNYQKQVLPQFPYIAELQYLHTQKNWSST